jgi:hypothetical protein
MDQVVVQLSSKTEAPSSNASTTQSKRSITIVHYIKSQPICVSWDRQIPSVELNIPPKKVEEHKLTTVTGISFR